MPFAYNQILLTRTPISVGGGRLLVNNSGLAYYSEITGLGAAQTGALTGAFYPLNQNPASYVTGSVVRPSETGLFYPTYNPSGFINEIPSDVVRTTGTQNISGAKVFNGGALEITEDPFVFIRNSDGSMCFSSEESTLFDFTGSQSICVKRGCSSPCLPFSFMISVASSLFACPTGDDLD